MKITEEQESILNTFKCERLSSDIQNAENIKNFSSDKGKLLVDYLQNFAWNDDITGKLAFYIVKSSENEIILFFSLQCGALFSPIDETAIYDNVMRKREIFLEGGNVNENITKITMDNKIKRLEYSYFKNNVKTLIRLNKDKEKEKNKNIIRVDNTYPSIELVHFCVNDNFKQKWKEYNFIHPVGEVMFWKYITPIIISVQNIVGCQYVFLFAADISTDGSLINYYNISLNFQQVNDIATNKPSYDFCCSFMCQKINEMIKKRKEYFDKFNLDENDVIA